MNVLIALVAALAAMTGWSGAEAAQARITDFAFSCETPEGRKLKPKFGDVGGVFYTDIPAQRQQCVEAVERKIALCRENTNFESNTKNEKYAECLPIFREQAQACVGHFQRELVKCDGGGVAAGTGTVTLDSSERRRVQAALAGAGFDPGPADGQFGPKTRRAIQAWQRANGYAATGALTSGQAEALLGGAVPLEAFGSNWSIVENQPCQVSNYGNRELEPFTWSGACIDGKASGQGRLTYSDGYGSYQGGMVGGKLHGRGTLTLAEGGRYEGEWRDGKRHGRGTFTWASGERHEGEWRDGYMHGRGTRTWPNGNGYTCEWRNDESVEETCEDH